MELSFAEKHGDKVKVLVLCTVTLHFLLFLHWAVSGYLNEKREEAKRLDDIVSEIRFETRRIAAWTKKHDQSQVYCDDKLRGNQDALERKYEALKSDYDALKNYVDSG